MQFSPGFRLEIGLSKKMTFLNSHTKFGAYIKKWPILILWDFITPTSPKLRDYTYGLHPQILIHFCEKGLHDYMKPFPTLSFGKKVKFNRNTQKSYKILQKLSPKHTACGVVQSPYPIYRQGKACLSKQLQWRAAGDPPLAHGRSRVRAPTPVGMLHVLIFSTLCLPSFLL